MWLYACTVHMFDFISVSRTMLCAPGYTGSSCELQQDPKTYCTVNNCFDNTASCKVIFENPSRPLYSRTCLLINLNSPR